MYHTIKNKTSHNVLCNSCHMNTNNHVVSSYLSVSLNLVEKARYPKCQTVDFRSLTHAWMWLLNMFSEFYFEKEIINKKMCVHLPPSPKLHSIKFCYFNPLCEILFFLFFFFETNGRHANAKSHEVVDHLASFPSSIEEISQPWFELLTSSLRFEYLSTIIRLFKVVLDQLCERLHEHHGHCQSPVQHAQKVNVDGCL